MVDGEKYGREDDDGCPYSWLNEWLCEYVDGTMDPSVRVTFEEYLEANPELAEHVECLRRTRELLCGQNKEMQVPRELRERLCQQTESEMMQDRWPLAGLLSSRAGTTAAVGSTMAVMLLVGMFVGATLFADTAHRDAATATAVTSSPAAESAETPPTSGPEEGTAVQRPPAVDRSAIPPHRPLRTQPHPAAVADGRTPLQTLIPSYLDESGAALPVMNDTIMDHGLHLSTRRQP